MLNLKIQKMKMLFHKLSKLKMYRINLQKKYRYFYKEI